MPSEGSQRPDREPELSAGAFRSLLEAFKEASVPLATDEARTRARRLRQQLKSLIEGQITDARWRELMHRAREAAERGEHEYLVLRFPSDTCTDSGRAIIEQESGWPSTLTGEASELNQHWRKTFQSGGFDLSARILEWPEGKPGDVGLFLNWHPDGRPHRRTQKRRDTLMRTMLLLTAGGPLVILTSHASPFDPELIDKLKVKGIRKFVAFEIPLELARERYANHFTVVAHDLHETDDLRVLDFDGQHAFGLFRFQELGQPTFHEGG